MIRIRGDSSSAKFDFYGVLVWGIFSFSALYFVRIGAFWVGEWWIANASCLILYHLARRYLKRRSKEYSGFEMIWIVLPPWHIFDIGPFRRLLYLYMIIRGQNITGLGIFKLMLLTTSSIRFLCIYRDGNARFNNTVERSENETRSTACNQLKLLVGAIINSTI